MTTYSNKQQSRNHPLKRVACLRYIVQETQYCCRTSACGGRENNPLERASSLRYLVRVGDRVGSNLPV